MPIARQRLFAVAPTPQIETGWSNFDGTPTIYITTDSGLNNVSLTLVNQVGDTVTFPPGTPAAFGQLPAGQSAIYLFFEGLISNAQIRAIQVTREGATPWNVASFVGASGLAYLVLAPTAQEQIPNGQGLEFQLTNILASADNSAPVYVTVAGATGIDPPLANTQVLVNVQDLPAPGNQALDLVVGFAGNDLVFTGGQANTLTLFLTNPNSTPLVPGGSSSWGPNPPTLQLSLVFGDGPGALTSAAESSQISVNIDDAFGNVWKPVAKQSQGEFPTWIMQPDPDGGGTVLGTGQNASISFDIAGIVTQLPQGLTFAYLSYRNIPGYDDGFFALEILKVDPIVISSFAASPPTITDATGPTQVALSFRVQNTSYVTITNTSYAKAVTSNDFSDSAQTTVYANTTYTLLANNFATGQQLSQALQVTVSPDIFHLVPTGTIVMWSGSTVPVGWLLCDGTNNTPNLVSKFIMGAALPEVGNEGGSSSHTHSAGASVTVSPVGSHAHGVPEQWYSNTASSGNGVTIVDRDATDVKGTQTQSAGGHTHNATSTVTVGAASNIPPYFALAFIMKTT